MGEELQAAYRAANGAVEELAAYSSEAARPSRRSPEEEAEEVEPAVDAFRNDVGAAGTTLQPASQNSSNPQAGRQEFNQSVNGSRSPGQDRGREEGVAHNRDEKERGAERRMEEGVDSATDQAGRALQTAVSVLQEQVQAPFPNPVSCISAQA